MALEWYFDKGAILSAGLYYKDIKDYIYTRVTKVNEILLDIDGTAYPHPEPDDDSVLDPAGSGVFVIDPYFLNEGINGDNVKVGGIEARYTQRLTFLPGDWSGLGFDMNYTLSDSNAVYEGIDEDRENFTVDYSFVGQSKHTVNAQVYWEKYGHSARLSYNYRSDSLANAITGETDSSWNDAYEQLDFSGRYRLNKDFRIGLQITNLLDVGQYRYHLGYQDGSPLENDVYTNRLGQYQTNGRTVRFTVDATF
jgi:TonB-dependent receptor